MLVISLAKYKNKGLRTTVNPYFIWSGQEDLNLRPPAPKAGALAKLRYAPYLFYLCSYYTTNYVDCTSD